MTRLAYLSASLVGISAFLYPFWLPESASTSRSTDAPFSAAAITGLALLAVGLEVKSQRMKGADVAILGMLSALGGMLRLLDLPGGGNGIFFLVLLAAAAFGARFGFLLGLFSMALGAVVTGGIGPWLPFQMMVLAWVCAVAGWVGLLTRRLHPNLEVAALALWSWFSAFIYGWLINLWSWPLFPGKGDLQWHPELSAGQTFRHYWSYYAATSLAWDAAGAFANLVAVAVLGAAVMRTFRRFAHRLDPIVTLSVEPYEPT